MRLNISYFFREKPIMGFLNDYTFLICGLLDLYECTLQSKWLQWADKLQEQQDILFWDNEKFGYYSSSDRDPSIILRFKSGKTVVFNYNILTLCFSSLFQIMMELNLLEILYLQ